MSNEVLTHRNLCFLLYLKYLQQLHLTITLERWQLFTYLSNKPLKFPFYFSLILETCENCSSKHESKFRKKQKEKKGFSTH